MTDRTVPADPREALALAAYLAGRDDIPNRDSILYCASLDTARALAARQDEPSPALRHVFLGGKCCCGALEQEALQDEPSPALRALVEARDYLASGSSVLNVLAYLNRNIAALAANPPQTREAD